jgi:UDP-GlcNAc:undecaprenyl-phosphate GlcNAc-1-phosphate transferase
LTNAVFKFLLAFAVTVLLIQVFAPLAIRVGLVDHPGGRKRHATAVPLIGGPAMFAAFVFSALLMLDSLYAYRPLFAGMGLLVMVGILDDMRDLSPQKKFLAQVAAALFVTSWAGLFVTHLGNLWGFGLFELRNWAIPFTVVCVLGTINAVNMSDGLDGLAGGLVLVSLAFFGAAAWDLGLDRPCKLIVLMTMTVCGFLMFNLRLPWQPRARVFMGDSGSMMLGLFLTWFAVELTHAPGGGLEPMAAVWFIAVPLLDMGLVIARRMFKGLSPFAADRTHLHHILIAVGFSPGQVTWMLIGLAVVCGSVGWVGWKAAVPGYAMFYGFVGVFGVAIMLRRRVWRLLRTVRRLRRN